MHGTNSNITRNTGTRYLEAVASLLRYTGAKIHTRLITGTIQAVMTERAIRVGVTSHLCFSGEVRAM
jgi:hypothetical protein